MNRNYSRFLSAHELLDWYFSGKFARRGLAETTAAFNDLMQLARKARPHFPDRHHQAELEQTIGADSRRNTPLSEAGNLLHLYKAAYLHPLALLQRKPAAFSSVQYEASLLYNVYLPRVLVGMPTLREGLGNTPAFGAGVFRVRFPARGFMSYAAIF